MKKELKTATTAYNIGSLYMKKIDYISAKIYLNDAIAYRENCCQNDNNP